MTRRTKRVGNVVERILERISAGETLAAICRSEDSYPTPSTWYDWLEADQDLSRRFARAREVGADVIADDALRIADTPMVGQTETDKLDGQGKAYTEVRRGDMIDHRKLQVHTRMQLLAKWQPKKYGDKVAHDHDVTGSLRDMLRESMQQPDPVKGDTVSPLPMKNEQ